MEQILEYIKRKYDPVSIILYGSYADGTNDRGSDFDALVISASHGRSHDTSFVDGVALDVFVYPASFFDENYDCEDFVQISDGKLLLDQGGRGEALREKVLSYLRDRPRRSKAEVEASVDWCDKMLARAKRGDTEGMFRWHWVLTDSLEIFCDAMRAPYRGPKKTIKWMEKSHPAAFACYQAALAEFDVERLENWIEYLKEVNAAD